MTQPCLKSSSSSSSLLQQRQILEQSMTATVTTITKTVHFGAVDVHEADEWDRSPILPCRTLSYDEALELKEIQLSLPRAIQPKDPFTGKSLGGHGICGTRIPVSLVPLLPEEDTKLYPPKPSLFSRTPGLSPMHSPRSSPPLPNKTPLSPFLRATSPSIHTSPTPPKPIPCPAHLSFLSQLLPSSSPPRNRSSPVRLAPPSPTRRTQGDPIPHLLPTPPSTPSPPPEDEDKEMYFEDGQKEPSCRKTTTLESTTQWYLQPTNPLPLPPPSSIPRPPDQPQPSKFIFVPVM